MELERDLLPLVQLFDLAMARARADVKAEALTL